MHLFMLMLMVVQLIILCSWALLGALATHLGRSLGPLEALLGALGEALLGRSWGAAVALQIRLRRYHLSPYTTLAL